MREEEKEEREREDQTFLENDIIRLYDMIRADFQSLP